MRSRWRSEPMRVDQRRDARWHHVVNFLCARSANAHQQIAGDSHGTPNTDADVRRAAAIRGCSMLRVRGVKLEV